MKPIEQSKLIDDITVLVTVMMVSDRERYREQAERQGISVERFLALSIVQFLYDNHGIPLTDS